MTTITEMLATTVRQHANRTAIVDGNRSLSYNMLEKNIASIATELQNRGINKGDRVSLLLPNGLDFVRSYFAIVALGAIVVPLNDQYQENELLYFLEECSVSVLITSKDYSELCHKVVSMQNSPCTLFFVESAQRDSENELKPLGDFNVQINPDTPVMYQFSSGSTGRPKRITRTHTNLLFELDSFIQTLNITKEDR